MYENLRRLHFLCDRWLRRNHIEVDWVARGRDGFAEMRDRVNATPGLMICNRAGGLEPLLCMRLLERRDDGIVFASGSGADVVKNVIGGERVQWVSDDLDGARGFVQGGIERMAQGGFALLFPSGKSDPMGPQPFRGGFRLLLKRMQPDWMVYACHMHPDDAEDYLARAGEYSLEHIKRALDDAEPVEPPPATVLTQRFDERFTTVAEWREAAGDLRAPEANERLTAYYRELFPTVRRPRAQYLWGVPAWHDPNDVPPIETDLKR
ncbi:MAG: hypothetical protein EB084_24750 [Proteobacteria bacterium]|nr:hypothetical protein [Pseudomonadota bacterium]